MSDLIVFDEAALDELFESPRGPAGRDLARRSVQVESAAKRLAPVDTGRLRSSISRELGEDTDGLVARVGTNVDYAPHVEFGTIRMRAQPYLRPALSAAKR
jgi:HK97 gp10 family phage protein